MDTCWWSQESSLLYLQPPSMAQGPITEHVIHAMVEALLNEEEEEDDGEEDTRVDATAVVAKSAMPKVWTEKTDKGGPSRLSPHPPPFVPKQRAVMVPPRPPLPPPMCRKVAMAHIVAMHARLWSSAPRGTVGTIETLRLITGCPELLVPGLVLCFAVPPLTVFPAVPGMVSAPVTAVLRLNARASSHVLCSDVFSLTPVVHPCLVGPATRRAIAAFVEARLDLLGALLEFSDVVFDGVPPFPWKTSVCLYAWASCPKV
jgi:hypothetical protein